MNPTDDPLDQKIDDLLHSRPLRADAAFKARILEATAREPLPARRPARLMAYLKFALPMAAAIAVAALFLNQTTDDPGLAQQPAVPSVIEAEEIFLLEAGLEGLASLDTGDVPTSDLLHTFEILYLEM